MWNEADNAYYDALDYIEGLCMNDGESECVCDCEEAES